MNSSKCLQAGQTYHITTGSALRNGANAVAKIDYSKNVVLFRKGEVEHGKINTTYGEFNPTVHSHEGDLLHFLVGRELALMKNEYRVKGDVSV